MAEFKELEGKVLTKILFDKDDVRSSYQQWPDVKGASTITFITLDGEEYEMYHSQDCCEVVCLEDVVGDINDLLMTPILSAELLTNVPDTDAISLPVFADDCVEWTFYDIRTIKGTVHLRWFGASNGYYATNVSFGKKNKEGYYE